MMEIEFHLYLVTKLLSKLQSILLHKLLVERTKSWHICQKWRCIRRCQKQIEGNNSLKERIMYLYFHILLSVCHFSYYFRSHTQFILFIGGISASPSDKKILLSIKLVELSKNSVEMKWFIIKKLCSICWKRLFENFCLHLVPILTWKLSNEK